MNLGLSEHHELLVKEARDFLERECPMSLVRRLREPQTSGHSPELWAKLAELGWLSLPFPEAHGGGGASFFDAALFSEQAGRVLLPTTFASTIFAADLIWALGSDAQRSELLSGACAGELVATVAFAERAAFHEPAALATSARQIGARWLLTGEKLFVANAHLADLIVVIARTSPGAESGLTAFLLRPGVGGVSTADHATFGRDRQSILRLDGVELEATDVLGTPGEAWTGFDRARMRATALTCTEIVGGCDRVLEMTVDHVKQRQQFGRPIGTFQAVQHHIANMTTSVEGARWAAYQAAWRLSEGLPARRELAIAKAWCSDVYPQVTTLAHQLHGGYGIVLEHDLHIYSERAKALQAAFGSSDTHMRVLAREIGLNGW